MMNAASSSLDPYQASMPHNGDPNSYAGLPMQPYYVDNFAHPVTRGPMVDQMPMAEGMAPLAPMTPAPTQRAAPMDFQSHSFVHEGRKYELQVVQQPKRARMCGFGDKDRRPITPPPCVRVIITDVVSGNEVDCNEIDHGMFVLNVDLWTEDGRREVNLIRHTATASPAALSISSTAPASFSEAAQAAAAYTNSANNMRSEPPTPHFKYEGGPSQESPFQAQAHPPYSPYMGPPTAGVPYGDSSVSQPYGEVAYQQGFPQPHMMNPAGFPPTNYQTQVPMYYPTAAGMHPQAQGVQPGMDYGLVSQPLMGGPPGMNPYEGMPYHAPDQELQRNPVSPSHPGGMFTRNLIGSLAASAFRLTDPDDRIGIWFVLQDLSVRAEGLFRLRFSFVNVGVSGPNTPASAPNSQYISSGAVNTGKAPVLASCFSEVFTVYSAKKFPGVVESTHLSKCFATQGIKIPIRKEAKNGKDRDEYDED